ncbi:hypothetical protein D3C85_405190 [compost metagenome]
MANPLGRLSMRKLISFVAALIVTIFAYIIATSPTTFAADAAWNGGNLSYESNQYNAMADAKEGDSTGIPTGSKVFGYSTNPADGPQKAFLIYFEPGVDPATSTSAKSVNYSYTPPNTYTNKSNVDTISIDSSSANNPTSTCTVEGVGWIVCSLSSFLAEGMDNVFNLLTGFVAVQPIRTSDQSGDLYKAWDVMRSIANIVFIIGFLIIIYSQLTSTGVSNYGVKKLLPRVIVAAILVNVSYYICAIAVDITNVLGYSMQHIFIQIRENLFGIHGNTWSDSMGNWASVTGFVLSGGATVLALGAGGAAALAATGGTAAAAIFLLLPILVGALITILVVLLILAARQAIIIILIIIAPLAFVAYLLPGTEKWFEKWRDLFMTMMIFFPAFSMVFGGAQLAGAVIIQNATSINLIILGLAVQVAPLAIAPLLMKLSGGFLNRIAGIVNNPGKGLVDRTRKWSSERAEMHKQRGLGDGERLGRRNFLRNGARSLDNRKRRLAERTANYSAMSDNRYNATSGHQELDMQRRHIEETKHIIEKELEVKWNAHVEVDKHALEQDLKLRVLTDEAALGKAKHDSRYEEFKAGAYPMHAQGLEGPQTRAMSELMGRADTTVRDLAIESLRTQNAKRTLNTEFAESMIASEEMQKRAGGIAGALGADSALASAVTTMRKDYGTSVEEARQIVKHFNLSSEDRQAHAMGDAVELKDKHNNVVRVLTAENTFTREAVIEDQIMTGTVPQVEQIIGNSGGSLAEFRTTISEAVAKAGLGNKAFYLGGATINEIAKGTISSPEKLTGIIQENIAKGKIKPETLATMDKDAVESILRAALQTDTSQMNPDLVSKLGSGIEGLKRAAIYATTNEELMGKVADNVEPLLNRMKTEL